MPRVRADDVGGPAGEHRDGDVGAGQPVGDLVQGAVAAEGHDDVVSAVLRLPPDLDRMLGGLRVDGLDVVAGLERVDDQVLEPIRDRGRVRVDDDQHPLLLRAGLERDGGCRGSGVSVGRGDRGHA